jgi:5-methylcytosine-specific restriction endonuclease McrA
MAVCSKCQVEKGADEFYARNRACKVCIRARRKARYYADPEKARAATRKYRQENLEKVKASSEARYRRDHPEVRRVRGRVQTRDELNAKKRAKRRTPEERAKIRAYKASVREREVRQARLRYHRDIEASREKGREAQRRRNADRDREAIDFIQIVLNDPCAFCDSPAEHVDHIEPIAKGGSNRWENLAGLCASCNRHKSDRSLLTFMLEEVG